MILRRLLGTGRGQPDPRLDAAWAAFTRGSQALEEGMRALLATVPTARNPGAPLEAGVHGFVAGAHAAAAEIPAWTLPELTEVAEAARQALDRAAALARTLPETAGGLEFEHRNERIDDVLAELDPLREAEQALRALRRRRRTSPPPPPPAGAPAAADVPRTADTGGGEVEGG